MPAHFDSAFWVDLVQCDGAGKAAHASTHNGHIHLQAGDRVPPKHVERGAYPAMHCCSALDS